MIAAAGGVAYWLYRTAPKARQRGAKQISTLVQVEPVRRTRHRAFVRAMGTVMAAQEVVVQPQVSGEIVKLSPELIPGGRVKAGDVLAQIDPKEYQIALDRAEADLVGKQAQSQSAAWEMTRLEGLKRSDAVNRNELEDASAAKAVAEAAVAVARASVDQARLDVERTTIRAPFNGIVTSKGVDLGAQVTTQTQLATLIGTDEYWVEASVPVDRLRWVTIPGKVGERGSSAVVYQSDGSGPEMKWGAHVHRLRGDLEPQGRMARVLVTVQDPLGLNSPSPQPLPLLIGAYVHVDIEGRELENVVAVPRSALRDGRRVWVMDDRAQLVIREVNVIWRDRDVVLLKDGLAEGERLVMSDIATPVAGMPLRQQGAGGGGAEGNRVACQTP